MLFFSCILYKLKLFLKLILRISFRCEYIKLNFFLIWNFNFNRLFTMLQNQVTVCSAILYFCLNGKFLCLTNFPVQFIFLLCWHMKHSEKFCTVDGDCDPWHLQKCISTISPLEKSNSCGNFEGSSEQEKEILIKM